MEVGCQMADDDFFWVKSISFSISQMGESFKLAGYSFGEKNPP